jgi:hypothetical protein
MTRPYRPRNYHAERYHHMHGAPIPEGYYADGASALEAHKAIEAEHLARAKELHARVAEWIEKNSSSRRWPRSSG